MSDQNIMPLADGRRVPRPAVDALAALEKSWPGATLPQARVAIVDAVLAALRERYAILELPEPEITTDGIEWCQGDVAIREDGLELDWRSITPEVACELAAALLAAANHAEATK